MRSLKLIIISVVLLSITLLSYDKNIQAEDHANIKQGTAPCIDILEASKGGDLKGVQQCITDGVDINSSVKGEYTALQLASKYGHLDVVNLLIKNGAKIDQQVELDGLPQVEGVIDYGDTALMYAISSGHINVVRYLIDNNADVNVKDFKYSTALIYASTDRGNLEIVKILIDNGADINAKNVFNNGVLALSLFSHNFNIAKYLIKSGADMNATDETGDTVLMWATREGNLELVKLFIDNGAAVNYKNIYTGQIALDVAIENRKTAIVKYLKSLKNLSK